MDTVDLSIKNLLKELATAEEFEKERLTFQVSVCLFTNINSFFRPSSHLSSITMLM